MSVWIHNSLTGSKEAIQPLRPPEVRFYACGPTVYDDPHIGHLRSAFVFDLARRVIETEFPVIFVRNVTDVDDKILDRALAEKRDPREVGRTYLTAYHRDLERMGIKPPSHEPRAADPANLDRMIQMITELIQNQTAYVRDGNVYFRVRRFERYGQLSHQNIDEILHNTRTEEGEGKEDPLDFALWKKAPETTWVFDSPWGKGRPGWHIECSAMSTSLLGEDFDIHGGGRDLLFPHHENERAQAMAATGKGFAKIWMHHGLVTYGGKKIAKSLKHIVSLEDVRGRFSVDALKLLFLQSHYASGLDYTQEKMEECEHILKRFVIFFEKTAAAGSASAKGPLADWLDAQTRRFEERLKDDFNTPQALVILYEVLDEANHRLMEAKLPEAASCAAWLKKQWRLLGLFNEPAGGAQDPRVGVLMSKLLGLREDLRKKARYEASDYIRDALTSYGFVIGDKVRGADWVLTRNVGAEELLEELGCIYEKAQTFK